MIVARAGILAGLLFACVSAPAGLPLDRLFEFEDAYNCTQGPEFSALVDGLILWREDGESHTGVLTSPPVPAPFRGQVATPELVVDGDEYRVTVPLRGTWRGLPLRSLVVVHVAESEGGFHLVFDATRDQVHRAANAAGFRIPSSGSEYREGEVLGVNVSIDEYEGGGALSCFMG